MKSIIDYIDIRSIKVLESAEKNGAIEELAMTFRNSGVCENTQSLVSALKEREKIMSTGIGFGIAIPHVKIEQVERLAFAVGVSKKGVYFDSIDGKPVHIILLLVGKPDNHTEYLALLSNIMKLIKRDEIRESIIGSESADEIYKIISGYFNR